MGKYFGTDGIRGVAFVDLTEELATRVGKATGYYLRELYPGMDILVGIGKDTRISGDRIEGALISGFISAGVSVRQLGIIPTPAVSRLTPMLGFKAGIVISASHNPVRDNGIKLFDAQGYKLSEAAEDRIEELLGSLDRVSMPQKPANFRHLPSASDQYMESILTLYPKNMLKGIKIIADLAHGATYKTTPAVLSALGAQVTSIHNTPDGNKINVACGSTNPDNITNYALINRLSFDVGITHDGDGDRVLALDSRGNLIDGDVIMSLCAMNRKKEGNLPGDGVVGTLMTNEGIIDFLKEDGITLYRSDVGDKYVLRDMQRLHYNIGGEQSGHILFMDLVPSGDGLVTSLEYLKTLVQSDFKILEKTKNINFYHQKLTNLRVKDQMSIMNSESFQTSLSEIVNAYPEVRINVRPSGTESILRILTEARNKELVDNVSTQIEGLVKINLNFR